MLTPMSPPAAPPELLTGESPALARAAPAALELDPPLTPEAPPLAGVSPTMYVPEQPTKKPRVPATQTSRAQFMCIFPSPSMWDERDDPPYRLGTRILATEGCARPR